MYRNVFDVLHRKKWLVMGQNETEPRLDPITGLPTRQDMAKALDAELAAEDINGAVMVIGLDNFQLVNEICGPSIGDEAMRQIAENIANVLPYDITLYQLSSDQFALYWHDCMPEEMEIVFASLQLSLRDIAAIEDKIYCTTTAGVAFYPRDGKDTDTLLKFAQAAKTIGKLEGGGDRICFFNQCILQTYFSTFCAFNAFFRVYKCFTYVRIAFDANTYTKISVFFNSCVFQAAFCSFYNFRFSAKVKKIATCAGIQCYEFFNFFRIFITCSAN